MAYFQRRHMAGTYRTLDYPLPSNSLTAMPNAAAAVAVVKAVANAAQRGRSGARLGAGMSGGYYRRRAGMGDVSSSLEELKTWVTANPVLSGGIAIAAVGLLGMGRKRR